MPVRTLWGVAGLDVFKVNILEKKPGLGGGATCRVSNTPPLKITPIHQNISSVNVQQLGEKIMII